jgi:5-methylcytosine-specific restriction enzyme A
MPTFLITWKPSKGTWADLEQDISEVRSKGFVDGQWSCGRSRRIRPYDRLFMLRQGSDRPGIMASGWALSAPYEAKHYDPDRPNDRAIYVDVRFDTILDPTIGAVLPRERLNRGQLADVHWNTQASGIAIAPDAAAELERIWSALLARLGEEPVTSPEEIAAADTYFEGATRRVSVLVYERSGYARRCCVEHYGYCCSVCGIDFEKAYGERGRAFIHVHHIVPISTIGRSYRLDPIKDLRPVCPNCHAMLHRAGDVLSVEALRKLFKSGPRSN